MPKEVIYKCCICHRVIENIDTIRLQKCLYHANSSGGHSAVCRYDFCKRCYSKIQKWIDNHKEVE